MAGSARTLITNVLPWAAVALLGAMFFVQVGARHRAENRAAKARDDLHALRADRVMGLGPKTEPLEPLEPPASEAEVARFVAAAVAKTEAEQDALRKELEQRAEELAAASAAYTLLT